MKIVVLSTSLSPRPCKLWFKLPQYF